MSRRLRLSGVMDRLRENGVEFFVNSRGEPTVAIPDDPWQKDWPVDSQRFRDYVVSVFFEVNDALPKPEETAFLCGQVREDCRKGGRRLSDVEVLATESEPIVQAIVHFMNGREKFRDRTVELLQKLREIQQLAVIDQGNEITSFVNLFSRQLKRLTPAFRGLGLEVELSHKEDGSYCTITRLPTFQLEADLAIDPDGLGETSSGKSSAVSTKKVRGLPRPDGADGNIRLDSPKAKPALGGPGNATDHQSFEKDETEGGAK